MPSSPGNVIWFGPDGGPFVVCSTANPLPVVANAGSGTFTVGGVTGEGAPLGGNPNRVGGSDGANLRTFLTDSSGRLILGAGTQVIGGITPAASATVGGASMFMNDAITGTVVQVKGTAGQFFYLRLVNTTAATAYLQIFSLPSASVVIGTTAPTWWIRLAANESMSINPHVPVGLSGGTGISLAGTTTPTGLTGAAISVAALYA